MPAASPTATTRKLVPTGVESRAAVRRVRLSKALAATPPTRPKLNGGKPKKLNLVSDRYKIPDNEYAQLTALKHRLQVQGASVKRSELLRAGLALLVTMDDVQLKKAVAKVAGVETGRPPQKSS